MRIFCLNKSEYEEVEHSTFFPDLDKALVLQYLGYCYQYDAVEEFTQAIRNSNL